MLKEVALTLGKSKKEVLILILMEHAQRALGKSKKENRDGKSLNPYFNGTCSKSLATMTSEDRVALRLNPYFNGTCSKRECTSVAEVHEIEVLILILMEHAQRECCLMSH